MAQYPEIGHGARISGPERALDRLFAGGHRRARRVSEEERPARLAAIDRAGLNADDQINYDLYRDLLDTAAQGLEFHNDAMPIRGVIPHNLLMPMNQIEGVQQDIPRIIAQMPAATRADYENIIARLQGVGPLVDQTIALDGAGHGGRHDAAAHHVPRRARRRCRRRSSTDPLKSPMLEAFTDVAGRHPRRGPRGSDGARDGRVPAVGGAGVHQAARLPDDAVSARVPRDDRRRARCPNGDAMYAYNVQVAHDHGEDAEGDPRDRPGRGEAHPRRDGRRHGVVRLQGQLRRLQAVPAHRARSSSSRTPRRC